MIDLWPQDIIENNESRAPVTILKEQAALLGQKTKNLLKAEVRWYTPGTLEKVSSNELRYLFDTVQEAQGEVQQSFSYAFYFVAPTLDNYRYKLLTISHGIPWYPVMFKIDKGISSEISGQNKPIIANSEEEFIDILEKIFKANKTKQIMKSILAQTSFTPG